MKRTEAQPATLSYGIGNTPIGRVLVVQGAKGVCALRLVEYESEALALKAVRRDCPPGAEFSRDDEAVGPVIEHICGFLSGRKVNGAVALDAKGTPFQHLVWRAMCKVPAGKTVSYQLVFGSAWFRVCL
jgi:O6-methylguanine-DNA--protein-cysteine methyltransferase